MPDIDVPCHACGHIARFRDVVPRSAECDKCLADLRCCRGCVHFEERAAHQCREPMAERISVKDRANFCVYFSPGQGGSGSATRAKDDARAKLDALFSFGGDDD